MRKSIKKVVDKEIFSMIQRLKGGILQVFSANVINKVIVMVSNMVITRVLTKSDFGLWSYILNIYSYASLCTGLGLASGALQFGAENQGKAERFSFYKYCLSIGLIINGIISVIFVGGSFLTQFSIPGAEKYLRFYVPVLLLEYMVEILLIVLRCEGRMAEYAKVLNVNTILVSLGTCVGAFAGITGVIIGKYIAAVVSVAYVVRLAYGDFTKIRDAHWIDKKEKKNVWHFSIFTGLSSTLNRVLYLIDVSMVANLMKNTSDVATYKVATMIPNSLYFIPSSIIIVVLPKIISNNNNKDWLRNNVKKAYVWLGILNTAIGIMLICFASIIITLISGNQYIDSIYPFRILVLGYVISGTCRDLSTNVLAGLRRVSFNLVISIISGVADIVLNYILIKQHGMIGAAYATFAVQVIASVSSLVFVVWVLKEGKVVNR